MDTMNEATDTISGVEGLVALPEEFFADVRVTHAQIDALNTDFGRAAQAGQLQDPQGDLLRAWVAWANTWLTYTREIEAASRDWRNRVHMPTLLWNIQGWNTRLEDFKQMYRRWRQTFIDRTGAQPTAPQRDPVVPPSQQVQQPGGALSQIRETITEWKVPILLGIGVVGVIAVTVLVREVKP